MSKRSILMLVAVLGLGGCASKTTLDASSTAVHVATELPPPSGDAQVVDFTNYRIGPLDKIVVNVFGATELTREGAVDSAGNFSMPLVGNVMAGGKTPAELGTDITEKLRGRYLKRPQVSVNIVEARAQTVTIDGSVTQPGVYPIIGNMTLQQALATARGATELSDLNKVVVFRTAGNEKLAAMFNMKDIRSGRYADPQIYANDIIVVGENARRRFMKDLTQSIPSFGSFLPLARGTGGTTGK